MKANPFFQLLVPEPGWWKWPKPECGGSFEPGACAACGYIGRAPV